MNNKFRVQMIGLELTRRCNMSCKHCMRGDAQAVDMEEKTIDKLLENVSHIGKLILSGGEPSLNVSLIKYISNKIKSGDLGVESFQLFTNGKGLTDEFIDVIKELRKMCVSQEGIEIYHSNDIYHDTLSERDKAKLQELCDIKYTSDRDEECRKYEKDYLSVANLGNAKNLDCEKSTITYRTKLDNNAIRVIDGKTLLFSSLYINVFGDVLFSIDNSYEDQENIKVGNIHSQDLKTILDSVTITSRGYEMF